MLAEILLYCPYVPPGQPSFWGVPPGTSTLASIYGYQEARAGLCLSAQLDALTKGALLFGKLLLQPAFL